MNKVITLLGVFISLSVTGQIPDPVYKVLDLNNSSALLGNEGNFFTDYDGSVGGYEIPKGSGIYSIYTSSFWFAGLDGGAQLKGSFGGVYALGRDSFKGPYSSIGNYDSIYKARYSDAMWEISQTEIDYHILHFSDLGYTPVQNIENWPAHGDVANGEAINLAPFVDIDLNGIYDPLMGDYPKIKGCKAIYMIQNDDAGGHSYTNSDPMGIEMHFMFYQYATWNYLNESTFIDVTVFNRGSQTFLESANGILMDADLGNGQDDFFGCDSINSVMVFYNGDNDDETLMGGYGINPPALGIVSLEQNFTSIVPYPSGPGITLNSRWNMLNGKMITGADHLDDNLNPTNFVYNGNPMNGMEWSEVSASNVSGDRKSVGANVHGTFAPGDVMFESYAIVYGRSGNNLENFQDVVSLASEAKSFYLNESDIPCQGATWGVDELNVENRFVISPNPSNGLFKLTFETTDQREIKVLTIDGKIIKTVNSNEFETLVNIQNEPNGAYLIIVSGSTINKSALVVKN